jgi:hypothetical protein
LRRDTRVTITPARRAIIANCAVSFQQAVVYDPAPGIGQIRDRVHRHPFDKPGADHTAAERGCENRAGDIASMKSRTQLRKEKWKAGYRAGFARAERLFALILIVWGLAALVGTYLHDHYPLI